MIKTIVVTIALTFAVSAAFAKKSDEKEKLVKNMVKSCKADLAKDPAQTNTTDGEAVWKNLEDKENGTVKLSKACHSAHEKYEAKYHKEDEAKEKAEHEGAGEGQE
jgi:hypothetical protein